jgi:GNAT superfamily N-acetyltransferase
MKQGNFDQELHFINCTTDDIDTIFHFYDDAIAFQKTVFNKHWKGFDRHVIEAEVHEGKHWKIMKGAQVACVFEAQLGDPLIWKEKDKDPSIYLHRIVSHSQFRGSNFLQKIIEWAKDFAKANSLKYIRLDTWGDNPSLISYYVKSGFEHVGFSIPDNPGNLPKHYDAISLALFELKVEAS